MIQFWSEMIIIGGAALIAYFVVWLSLSPYGQYETYDDYPKLRLKKIFIPLFLIPRFFHRMWSKALSQSKKKRKIPTVTLPEVIGFSIYYGYFLLITTVQLILFFTTGYGLFEHTWPIGLIVFVLITCFLPTLCYVIKRKTRIKHTPKYTNAQGGGSTESSPTPKENPWEKY